MPGPLSLPGGRADSYLCSRRPCGRQRGATGASAHHRTGGGASTPAAPRRSSQETRHDQPPGGGPVSKEAPERVVDDPNVVMQNSPEFDQLRSKFRKFVFPLTALFLAWYFLYVLLSVFAKDFMGTRV